MLVLAGPGSGKTFVVTQRIKALIEEYYAQPSRILVITFTKAAAQEMRERFAGLTDNRYAVQFGTFHAFFYQILRQSSYRRDIRILSESQKYHYIRTIIRQCGISVISAEEFAGLFLGELSRMKNSGKTLQEYEPSTCGKELFQTVCLSYERRKEIEGKIDFDDMLHRCCRLLRENIQLRRQWQERFTYLLLDEVQDMNEIQYQIVRLLTETHANVFAVGDDDQSIYGFRGARPDIMKRLLEDYKGCRQIMLSDNYRCVKPIVQAAGKVIAHNKNRMPKPIQAVRRQFHSEHVRIKIFRDREEENHFLLEELLRMDSQDQKNTAVIFRTNRDMSGFAQCLTQAGIPFHMKEKAKSMFRHFIAVELLACLRFAGGEYSRELLYQFMNHPYRGIRREWITDSTVDIHKLAQRLSAGADMDFSGGQVLKLAGDLNRLRRLPPYAALQYICRGMGYEADLKKRLQETGQEEGQILADLLKSARGMHNLKEWMAHIEKYERQLEESAADSGHEVNTGTGIWLLTMHGAKGLEYKRVYLPRLNEGILPHKKSITGGAEGTDAAEALEEECRMLYVGMTRARDFLCMSYLTGTKEKPEHMSRFLLPLL